MQKIKELEKEKQEKSYVASKDEQIVSAYVSKRIKEMKDFRKNLGIDKDFEEADKEYIPEELDFSKGKKRLEADQETGLRSRMVPIGDESDAWRSRNSDPMLLTKIQTGLSIMIDRMPESTFTALLKRYEKTSDLAKSLWKRSWQITNAKEIYKLIAFNQFKYGWAVGRSYPRIIKYDKECLYEIDEENPENNKYEEKELVWFNDVARQALDPKRTWIDELSRPYDRHSRNENYFELDYSYDSFMVEFGSYSNSEFVMPGDRVVFDEEQKTDDEDMDRKDLVTVGFYENRLKDLYVILIPSKKMVLYYAPLPNDDGLLSLWDCPFILRDANSPYGISLWRLIKQDKALYDKMKNMTMDQLVVSIMKMGFHTGVGGIDGDGNIKVVPGKIQQITNGDVKWMEVPGPGKEAWEGLQTLKGMIDDTSGITPTLDGEITGKTLGEVQIARESALKRMRIPLENLADAMEQDAYLTLSWMSQIYSTPEIKEFASIQELKEYEEENLISVMQENDQPQLFASAEGKIKAPFLPQLALHLQQGTEGTLIEGKDSRYFQVGKDITPKDLKWRGIISVDPQSILSPSLELEKQGKTELFNILAPLLPQPPEVYAKAASELIKIRGENPEDWLPDPWIQFLKQGAQQSLFIQGPTPEQQMMQQAGAMGIPPEATNGVSMQAQAGTQPNQGASTVLPKQFGQQPVSPGVTAKMPAPRI